MALRSADKVLVAPRHRQPIILKINFAYLHKHVGKMSNTIDWDDLRYILAIARAGSLGGAAKALGVNQSSVYRRLENFEQRMDVRLFERRRTGYRLTTQGEALADTAKRIEAETLTVERQLLGSDLKLSGQIRVSTGELLGMFLLPNLLNGFADAFPDVQVELSLDNQLADLTRGEADVVVRGTSNPPDNLVGRRVSDLAFCAYAHRSYLDRAGRGRSLDRYSWLGFENRLSRTPQARWIREKIPAARIQFTFDSSAAMYEGTRCGLGAAVLPCFAADPIPDLERISETITAPGFGIWVLTHPDLRRSAKIRAFTRDIGERIGQRVALLAGHTPYTKPQSTDESAR